MFKHCQWSLSLVVVLGLVGVVRADLIDNGDFSGGTAGTFASGSDTGTNNSVPTDWLGYATADKALKVDGGGVVFNAGNEAALNWVQQTVDVEPDLWYALEWDHVDGPGNYPIRAVSSAKIWDGSTATGTPDLADRSSRYPTLGLQQVFKSISTEATLQMGDAGSNTTSNDTKIDNVSLALADGSINIAPYGTATAKDKLGSWVAQQAVDGSRHLNNSGTVYHSLNSNGTVDDWWKLTFPEPVQLTRLEVVARNGYNARNGESLILLDADGGVIDTLSLNNMALWEADGYWGNVSEILIDNGSSALTLNLAEVRAFAPFADGVMVPEPGSIVMMVVGLPIVGLWWRRRRRTVQDRGEAFVSRRPVPLAVD